MDNVPIDINDWINSLCLKMIAKTIDIIFANSRNGTIKLSYTVWIKYHYRIYGAVTTHFHTNLIRSKYPFKEALRISCNHGRALIYISRFRKWDENGTHRAKPCDTNYRFIINGYPDDVNIFLRKFQNNITAYHPKDQYCKAKLQSCP